MRIIDSTGKTVADGKSSRRITMRYGVQNIDGTSMLPGQTYAVPDWFALEVVSSGRAVYAKDPAPAMVAPVATPPEVIEQRDPVPESRDPKPRRGFGRRS